MSFSAFCDFDTRLAPSSYWTWLLQKVAGPNTVPQRRPQRQKQLFRGRKAMGNFDISPYSSRCTVVSGRSVRKRDDYHLVAKQKILFLKSPT